MKNLFVTFSLFAIAIILLVLATPLGLLWALIDGIRRKDLKQRANQMLFNGALSLDKLGNALYYSMLNSLFIKTGGHHFGGMDITISADLGHNQIKQSYTLLGEGLAALLDWIDPYHCLKAIDHPHPYLVPAPRKWTAIFFILNCIGYAIALIYCALQLLAH